MTNKWIAPGLAVLCIILFFLWLKKPSVTFNEQPLLDSLAKITKEDSVLQVMNTDLLEINDSLERVKQKTLILYKDKLVFIGTADLRQTDSLIRDAIKIK